MEKIKTEEVRRKRGRPKLDARITEEYAPSRRQALNKMYMYEGVHLLSVAATEIPNSEVLWREDRTAATLKSRDGILEQLGRMAVQDKLGYSIASILPTLPSPPFKTDTPRGRWRLPCGKSEWRRSPA